MQRLVLPLLFESTSRVEGRDLHGWTGLLPHGVASQLRANTNKRKPEQRTHTQKNEQIVYFFFILARRQLAPKNSAASSIMNTSTSLLENKLKNNIFEQANKLESLEEKIKHG